MTPFTDEDLKQLKGNIHGSNWMSDEKVEALIARLDAAEKVCHYVHLWLVNLNPNTDIDLPLIEWRKSAGKL